MSVTHTQLKKMTLEELEELEQDLHDKEDNIEYSLYAQKISVYKEMYARLHKLARENKEVARYLEYVKKKLLFCLIHYGTHLKMKYEKDDKMAVNCLEQALKYDGKNPIAAYRLGFLSYKQEKYDMALNYFQMAIRNQTYDESRKDYRLNHQQMINAHLYLTNSALYIAAKTHDELDAMTHGSQQELPNYEFSSLYRSLKENETYLEKNAFYKVSQDGKVMCSKQECEELIESELSHTIFLYFSDRDIRLSFGEYDCQLSPNHARIFHYLLTNTSQHSPGTRINMKLFFTDSHVKDEVTKDAFKRAISRLRGKIRECDIPNIIQTTNHYGETAYYFDGQLPYYVMYRVDDPIE
ncbi:hypothetical protein [Metabacillus iocasae]|uniref:Tetratricopeptide (TPR) repeat protein n=1 Tax=Priestia iocasae TaxID=2291674 RepID=A0ABS2QRP1_9BACI|nr:hypothetical protein [Metabacillus iocasae]MBM7702111.1 tetratricopeptide (TPR) repeat protein [Metabacillus iocasae]